MSDATTARTRPLRGALGALPDGGGTTFRVWAPEQERVDLVIEEVHLPPAPSAPRRPGKPDTSHDIRPLQQEDCGYWAGRFEDVPAGTRYRYRLGGDDARVFPDPASRFQPDGVHGASMVVEAARYAWTDTAWQAPALDRLVIYELHVGTFSHEGTFRGVVGRLPHLAALGVTAIELMPVGDFAGDRNWGYDGVAIFAPARCYGVPDDLRALVDAAHRLGIAVLLDVVYNHFGPDGAYANAFSPYYFTDAHRSPWGRGVNLDGPHSEPVRRFFIENALHWIREYHMDGLRLDATHALQDDGPRHFLEELASSVRAHAGPAIVVAEDHRNLAALMMPPASGGAGLDGVWADDFHHQVRVHTAGDRESYYADYSGSAADIAATLRQGWFYTGQHSPHLNGPRGTDPTPLDLPQFVICTQNHDQVGNRADGARLHHDIEAAAYRAATAVLLLAPETPLLFMGQEWAATSPFLFFTDHHEELGRLISNGRREEFRSFAAFSDPEQGVAVPDPQDLATFERSRLVWDEIVRPAHAGVLRLHQRLLALRRAAPALRARTRDRFSARALDGHTVAFSYAARDPLLVVARLSGGGGRVRIETTGPADLVLSTEDEEFVAEPRPASVSRERGSCDLAFARPGAVVLRG